jgi:hypothetical protein
MEYRILADLIVENLRLHQPLTRRGKGAIRELSASGCRLESSLPLDLGQELVLGFPLEGGHRVDGIRARVVRRLSQRSHKVVAVEFMGLSEQEQYKIREFVVWKEAQGAEK